MPTLVRRSRPVSVTVTLPREIEEAVTEIALAEGGARSHVVARLLRKALEGEQPEGAPVRKETHR